MHLGTVRPITAGCQGAAPRAPRRLFDTEIFTARAMLELKNVLHCGRELFPSVFVLGAHNALKYVDEFHHYHPFLYRYFLV